MEFTISLNEEMAAVLLRCLGYGEAAISATEIHNGVEKVIVNNINLMRCQVCKALSNKKILEAVE